MLKNNILKLKKFSSKKNIVHGFTTKKFGNLRPGNACYTKNLHSLIKLLNTGKNNIITMNQAHSDNIMCFNSQNINSVIDNTDAIFTKKVGFYPSVLSADCVPLLFYDVKGQIVGVIHAGWKGLYKKIIKRTFEQILLTKTNPQNIIIGIGPNIRSCCYEVSLDLAMKFKKKFPAIESVNFLNNKYYLDLTSLAINQLLSVGIKQENIDDCGLCTFENNDLFYSYRREGAGYGASLGFIGIKDYNKKYE